MLPKILNVRLQPNVFPTTWQAVLFKNYGYAPLTKEQIARTETLAKKIQAELAVDRAEPFDFFTSVTEKQPLAAKKGTRIVHGYLSPCGDAFIEDSRNYMPDGLLEEYAARGINGVSCNRRKQSRSKASRKGI